MSIVTAPTTPAPQPGSAIRSILSSNSKKKQNKSRIFTSKCNSNVNFKYIKSTTIRQRLLIASLVDGGTNGGLAVSYMRLIEKTLA